MKLSLFAAVVFLSGFNTFSQSFTTVPASLASSSVQSAATVDSKKTGEYLVVFNWPCLLEQFHEKAALKSASIAQSLRSGHEQFVSDLWAMRKGSLKSAEIPEIRHELFNTVNAVVIESNEAEVEQIKALGYVKRVLKNERKQFLNEPIRDNIQKTISGATNAAGSENGEGIKVGVIDTGIDYNNPALGGGFGPNFKVAGGYDFENHDDDPIDDYGHGTAVAGIIAAEGQLTGIAPKATLYAFKIIDSWGIGMSNNIVLALERCIDPNQDGDLSDHLDVVNISGGSPHLNTDFKAELFSIFRRMAELKIIVCVAAGNDGPAYQLFNQVSVSDDVLAVGSCNSQNSISPFSSRNSGSGNDYRIKPDVVALGEGIKVLGLANTTSLSSGTSLSCPLVTGMAALLKQKHKAWTCNQLKSALVNSSDDLGFNVMEQGGGKANQSKALNQETTVFPQTISWGISTANSGVYHRTCKIQIHNHSAEKQVYKFEFGQNLPDGITLRTENQNIAINANDTATVTLEFSVDQAKLKYPGQIPYNHFGTIKIQGTTDYLSVPWTILRGGLINFQSDIAFSTSDKPVIRIMKDGQQVNLSSEFDAAQVQVVPPGRYDFLFHATEGSAAYPYKDTLLSYFYIKENVLIDGGKTAIDLTKKVIKNRILFQSVDDKGNILSAGKPLVNHAFFDRNNNYFEMIAVKDKANLKVPVIQTGSKDRYYINDFPKSDKYQLYAGEYKADNREENNYTILNYEVTDDVKSDLILKNSPTDLVPYHFMFNPAANEKCTSGVVWGRTDVGYSPPDFKLEKPSFNTLWINEKSQGELGLFPVPGIFISEGENWPLYVSSFGFSYPYGDSIVFKSVALGGRVEFQPVYKNDTIWVNSGPVYYSLNIASRLNYKFFGAFSFMKGMYGEVCEYGLSNSTASIKDQNNTTVYQKKIKEYNNNPYTGNLEGKTFEISSNDYYINVKRGNALLQYQIGSNVPDQFTCIQSLKFLDNRNKLRSTFKPGSKGKLRLILNGDDRTRSVKLYFRKSGAPTWESKAFTSKRNQLAEQVIEADITDLLVQESDISFKIVVEEQTGYTMIYTLEPAVSVSKDKLFNSSRELAGPYQSFSYPNPAKDFITVKNASELKEISVIDLNGNKRINLVQSFGSQDVVVDISFLPRGTYILYTKGEKHSHSEKILKL